jgi:hypothetical protein
LNSFRGDPLAWRQTLTRQSLTRVDRHGLQMHRLTQAILREHPALGQGAAASEAPGRSWPTVIPATREIRSTGRGGRG